jgi:serine/threonine protein kinase
MTDNQSDQKKMLINEQYLTVKKIGQGGFGIVWKAYDFSLRNFVAIKELLKDYTEAKYVEMFYHEALIAKNINHDNIVRVQHFWQGSNGSYFISMDYVSGNDLEHLMRICRQTNKALPWELIVLICGSVLKALDYANRIAKDTITCKPYGIVYRDISPENIMISYEGGVKLSDFGIAKTADDLSFNNKRKIVTGKFGYMSPEQTRGDADIDHRSDIFSVGVVLYEMLMGRKLFTGTPEEIKKMVLELEFDPTELYSLNIPDELVDIVAKALARDRENRYEKAIEMFRDLRRLLKGKETEELTVDLSSFVNEVLADEMGGDNQLMDTVRNLSLQDVKNDPSVVKITCKNFIVGETTPAFSSEESKPATTPAPAPAPVPPAAAAPAAAPAPQPVPPQVAPPPASQPVSAAQPSSVAPPHSPVPVRPADAVPPVAFPGKVEKTAQEVKSAEAKPAPVPAPAPRQKTVPPAAPKAEKPAMPAAKASPAAPTASARKMSVAPRQAPDEKPIGEEKGKTVFEEVGDWLVNRFKGYRARVVRACIAVVIAAVLFLAVDMYARITSFGKKMYSWVYPPDVVLSTVPPGARVSMKSRDGKVVLSDADSDSPIELRKIPPRTYIVTAAKEGFKTVERVVRIEEPEKARGEQRIEVYFDFPVVVDSKPEGADVYIDGNKFKAAPWKGELTAGEHTIKLVCPGFEDLGSLAKENKEGQCNIDFTRARDNEVFGGVDQRYWTCGVNMTGGEKVYTVTGNLFKRFSIKSSPSNMIVHIQNESKPRGSTPLNVALMAGEYRIRFMDPQGRYEETSRLVRVDKDSKAEIFASLNKWVTIKVGAKEKTDKMVKATVRITGNDVAVSRDVTSTRPVRVAIPVGTYRIAFESDGEFKPLVLKNVNVAEQSSVVGEMEFANALVKIAIKDETTGNPVEGAYIWLLNRVIGTTDAAGTWQGELKVGKSQLRIVAKGYLEKSMERTFEAGQKDTVAITLASDKPVAVSTGAVTVPSISNPYMREREAAVVPAAERRPSPRRSYDSLIRESVSAPQPAETATDKKIIVCPNCKKEYIVGPKKLRFCTNCGKPFR